MKIEKATIERNNKPITVYSKPNCMACDFTKNFLSQHGIEYREVNVMENLEALRELKSRELLGLPVVSVGDLDNSWIGINMERLNSLL